MRVATRIFHQVRNRIKGNPNKVAPGEDAELKKLLFTEGDWFYATAALTLALALALALAPAPAPALALTQTLDGLLARLHGGRQPPLGACGLLKLDVQGAELP